MRGLHRLVLAGLLIAAPAHAQQTGFDFYAYGPYVAEAPRPDSVLGYAMGELHTTYGRMERYFDALAAAMPARVRIEPYGMSYERQRLRLVVIGDERNIERLGEIRAAVQALADPRRTAAAEAARLAATTPIVVWLNYANDGDETAAFEAAMQVAYQLAAGEDADTRRLREGAVVVINPAHNPESHERFVAWYNAFGVGSEHPQAMERFAPWGMNTNNNHYQIDLNRDALGLTQTENQALAAAFLRWRPQVFVDHHGQTTQFFFPPPVLPVNASLPAQTVRWMEVFGRGNARAFDEHGWLYYTRDVFDLHYPGYWDSWPALQGATGMTYETDGGGRRGLRFKRDDGTIVTFRDGIARHFVASLATVRTAAENREARLLDYHAFFREAWEQGQRGAVRAYVLEPGRDPRRAATLASTLLRHGVEVKRTTSAFRADAREHRTGRSARREFAAGAYLIDMAQPQKRIAETLLAVEAPLEPEFIRDQIARWSRNARRGAEEPKERYEFYDVTAWSLPLAFGVDAYALAAAPAVDAVPVQPAEGALVASGGWTEELAFGPADLRAGVGEAVVAGPGAAPARARTAYVFGPESEGAARLAARLLAEEYNVAVALRPLLAGAREFPRGSFVVRVERNPADLHERIDALAREAGVEVAPVGTAFAERGPTGVGSETVVSLERPRIAVAADDGVGITSYGAAWFTLEQRLGYPFTPMRFAQLAQAAPGDFNVIVLPDGSGSAYERALGTQGMERLKRWIEGGGTLVVWGGAAAWVARAGWLGAAAVTGDTDDDRKAAAEHLAAIDRLEQTPGPRAPVMSPSARPGAVQPVPGAILRAAPDPTHWLTAGLPDGPLPVLVRGDNFLGLTEKGANAVVFPADGELRISGFVWPGNTERLLAGSAYAVVEPVGRGHVVAFTQDPNFRLIWRSTSRLFANAVLLGPTLAAPARRW